MPEYALRNSQINFFKIVKFRYLKKKVNLHY